MKATPDFSLGAGSSSALSRIALSQIAFSGGSPKLAAVRGPRTKTTSQEPSRTGGRPV
jgi:hypothetical protein